MEVLKHEDDTGEKLVAIGWGGEGVDVRRVSNQIGIVVVVPGGVELRCVVGEERDLHAEVTGKAGLRFEFLEPSPPCEGA